MSEQKAMYRITSNVPVSFPTVHVKTLDALNLDERVSLAHTFRGSSPRVAGAKAGILWQMGRVEYNCSIHGSQEAEQG